MPATMTIPSELIAPDPDTCYNAGWLTPEGEFQFAADGHEAHRSAAARGYEHLDSGWVRITCTPERARGGGEIGCQMRGGHVATDEQVAAILTLAATIGCDFLVGDREYVEHPSTADDVRRALGV